MWATLKNTITRVIANWEWEDTAKLITACFFTALLVLGLTLLSMFAFHDKQFRGYYMSNNNIWVDWNWAPDELAITNTDPNITMKEFAVIQQQDLSVKIKR